MMATRLRPTAQRSGVALAALLVASMSVHDHRVTTALHNGLSDTSGTAVDASQPARLVKASFGASIAHHYGQ